MKIPKIFHQTWYTSSPHAELAERIEQTKIQNPDWEYKLWSDDDIINWLTEKGFIEELNYFNSIAIGPAKADLFRMLILYHEGGFYMDLDNILVEPINEWLHPDAECVVGMNGLQRVDFNLCGAVPQNIYVENTLISIMRKLKNRVDGSALSVTGPCNWKSHNRNNKKKHPDREYKIQIVAGTGAEDKGWPEFPQGQIGTPPADHYICPVKFVFTRDRKPWQCLPKDRPKVVWQKNSGTSLYHDN
jgi:mannosyltransferase OCH1-like enzyme